MADEERKKSPIVPLAVFMARKAGFLLLTFFIFLIIIFFLPRLVPASPISSIMSRIRNVDPASLQRIEKFLIAQFGLDKPIQQQFVEFIFKTFSGDLGTSFYFMRPVAELIFARIPYTLMLLVPATIVSWILGNLLGAIAAYKRGKATDNVLLTVFLFLSNTPYYWLAMILLFFLAVRLSLFPTFGAYNPMLEPSFTPEFIIDYLRHYVLPFLSIVLSAMGGWAIGMRVMSIYELGSDYINYSDSLGLKDSKLREYVFRNSILPQVTGLALNFGSILGGAVITETVFNYRGTGELIILALTNMDYTLIQGTFVLLISTLLLANLIIDFIYAYLDPRVKTGYVVE